MWYTTTEWIPQKQKSRSSPALLGGDNRWSYCWRQTVSVDVWFTPASWTVLWLSDGDSSLQFRMSSYYVRVLRTFRLISKSGFLICNFSVSWIQRTMKTNVVWHGKCSLGRCPWQYGEPFCYFLSQYRVCACRSIPSNWHNARLLLMKPCAQQINEKHTAATVEMNVFGCGVRGGWGKEDNRQMTGANLTLSWFVQYKVFLAMRTLYDNYYFGPLYHPLNLSVLFCFHAVCMYVCVFVCVCLCVCLLAYQARSPWHYYD